MAEREEQTAGSIDYARSASRQAWLHHPVVGDPSFDSFVHHPSNPLLEGSPPYEWPVNGSIFVDPVSGYRYVYVGLYPRGYWPAGPCRCFRSTDEGGAWEDLGIVMEGAADTFDGDGEQPGVTPDVHLCFADGRYHMVYDWANRANTRGGIAYAWSESPAGPFHRAQDPIHLDTAQKPNLGRYVRVYAASIFRRKGDWLILAMMSTPGNAGGTWAHVALTSERPEGGYGEPTLLQYPQSLVFHSAPVEYFPSFLHEGVVYSPATSVAANRTYQIIYAAPLEDAHRPEAWCIADHGSVWHAEPVPHEAAGIWGQTFSGFVSNGRLLAMFPSKTADDRGTINLAEGPWAEPFRDRFVLSANAGPALGIEQRSYTEFRLRTRLRSTGPFAVVWGHTAPLGPDKPVGADCRLHAAALSRCVRFEVGEGSWSLVDARDGSDRVVAQGAVVWTPGNSLEIDVEQAADAVAISMGGTKLLNGKLAGTAGCTGLLARGGSILEADQFEVSGERKPAWLTLSAFDATMGSGAAGGDWEVVSGSRLRFGEGCRSAQGEAAAKWNLLRPWLPAVDAEGAGSRHGAGLLRRAGDGRTEARGGRGAALRRALRTGCGKRVTMP